MPFFGAQNVGAGWGPPRLSEDLLRYYNEVARQGLGELGSMLGGALAGGLSKNPETGKAGGLKGALSGAAQALDPELRRQNQEWKALQMYAQAAHGIPKEVSNVMGLPELKGLVQGLEAQQLQQQRQAERDRLRAMSEYYQQLGQAQQASAERRRALDQAREQWVRDYTEALDAYGDAAWAAQYATKQVPEGVPESMLNKLSVGESRDQKEFQPQVQYFQVGEEQVPYLQTGPSSMQPVRTEKAALAESARAGFFTAMEELSKAYAAASDLSDPEQQRRLQEIWNRARDFNNMYKNLTGRDLMGLGQPPPSGYKIREYTPAR